MVILLYIRKVQNFYSMQLPCRGRAFSLHVTDANEIGSRARRGLPRESTIVRYKEALVQKQVMVAVFFWRDSSTELLD